MAKKLISKKVASSKYGIVIKRFDDRKYYLLPNGNVVDSDGDVRYYKPTEYDKVIDALNRIDEQADSGGQESYREMIKRGKDYRLVADFIDKHAKR